MNGNATNGQDNYVVIHLINNMSSNVLSIRNAQLRRGKFYENGNKDSEIVTEDINNISVQPWSTIDISACGRFGSSNGTEGSIELYDGETKICKLHWDDLPNADNDFQLQHYKIGGIHAVSIGNWNRSRGSLGTVTVEIMKKG